MAKQAKVAVLGAGIVGCAAAYYLANEGARVTVIERNRAASGASGYAFGLLNPLTGTGIPGPMQPLAEAAFGIHRELALDLDRRAGEEDIQSRMVPHLELNVGPDEENVLRKQMDRWDGSEGFSARWLEPRELIELEPRFDPGIREAVLLQDVVLLDSRRLTRAVWQAARERGAEHVTGEVMGLKSEGDRPSGVVVGDKEIDCDAVVVALGPWSGVASPWLGMNVPVKPLKGQMLHLEGLTPRLEYHVHGEGHLSFDPAEDQSNSPREGDRTGPGCVFAQKADGLLWVGATEEDLGFDLDTTTEAMDGLMEQATRLMPSIGEQRVVAQTACLRPITPDRMPIVGRVPGWDGVYLATGAEKKGILIGPAMGRAAADLVVRGTTSIPIAAFGMGRFS